MSQHIPAYHCTHCGRQSLVPQGYCSQCRSAHSYEAFDHDMEGTVFSYTIIYVSDEKFQADVPYVLAIIECPGGLRVLGRLYQPHNRPVAIGQRVKLHTVENGVAIFHNTIS